MPNPFIARQSTLKGLTQCPRRTFHDITREHDGTVGYSEATADLGTLIHEVAAEILRTLYATSQTQMPTQEAVEIAYEVYAASHIVLPAQEAEDLIWLTLRFVERTWRVDKLMTTPEGEPAVEQRINVPIVCQDGAMRVLSCQPDAIFAGGPDTLVVPDWKTSQGQPKSPRSPQEDVPEDVARGKQYLSSVFQGTAYSLAALHLYPGAQRVLFRELHLRSGLIREAFMGREDMEHAYRHIGLLLQKLDAGLEEGEDADLWVPRPGRHCARQCPVARSCPVPAEQRGLGVLETDELAAAEASRFVVVDALRGQMRDALKARHEEDGKPIPTGDGQALFWRTKPDGKRAFGVHDLEEA